MTELQLNYLSYLEDKRSNKVREAETERNNRATLAETMRANLARESETFRSNLAREAETHRSNLATETETARSNRAREAETYRSNLARELETKRSNLANETLKRAANYETVRSNLAKERLTHEANQITKARDTESARHNVAVELESERHNKASESSSMLGSVGSVIRGVGGLASGFGLAKLLQGSASTGSSGTTGNSGNTRVKESAFEKTKRAEIQYGEGARTGRPAYTGKQLQTKRDRARNTDSFLSGAGGMYLQSAVSVPSWTNIAGAEQSYNAINSYYSQGLISSSTANRMFATVNPFEPGGHTDEFEKVRNLALGSKGLLAGLNS